MKNFCRYEGSVSDELLRRKYLNSLYKEIFRKSIHMCTALVPLLLKWQYSLTIVLLFTALVLYSVVQIIMLHGKSIPFVSLVIDVASRSRDDGKFVLGPVTLVLGILVSAFLYSETACAVGVFALAFGDGLASLGGKFLGRLRVPFTGGKTCAGSLVCLTAIFVSTYAVTRNAFLSLICSVCGMLIEILPLKDFDNLAIPVLIGGIAELFFINEYLMQNVFCYM